MTPTFLFDATLLTPAEQGERAGIEARLRLHGVMESAVLDGLESYDAVVYCRSELAAARGVLAAARATVASLCSDLTELRTACGETLGRLTGERD